MSNTQQAQQHNPYSVTTSPKQRANNQLLNNLKATYLQGQKLHKDILQAKRDESLKKLNDDIKRFQLPPQSPALIMMEEANKIKEMPEEVKEQHLQMLGLMKGYNGRTQKKKQSVTQVQVRKNLEKIGDSRTPEEITFDNSPSKGQIQNDQPLINNNSYGEMKLKKITAAYKSQAQDIFKTREQEQNNEGGGDWEDQRLSKFRVHHRRKLPEIINSQEVTARNKSVTKTYLQPSSDLNTQHHSPSSGLGQQRVEYSKEHLKNSQSIVKNSKFGTLESNSPTNNNLEVTRDHSQMISQYRLNQNASRFIKRMHHQRSISHANGLSAMGFGNLGLTLNDYGTVNFDGKDLSTIGGGTTPNMDLSNMPSLRNQDGEIITETVPYVLSKDGPNAHQFKFQTVKRVNHIHNILYRNVSKQHRESLQVSKENYANFLQTQKRPPYIYNYNEGSNNVSGSNSKRDTSNIRRNIQSQQSHYYQKNPLVSDVTGQSQFDEHELQKSMIIQEAVLRQAAEFNKSSQDAYKPGQIVDRVKDELHRTVQAKRKLLEKNFINFRFDEFKKEQLKAKQQIEENEMSGAPLKMPQVKTRDQSMWKSIQVYTPKKVQKFQSKMLSPKVATSPQSPKVNNQN